MWTGISLRIALPAILMTTALPAYVAAQSTDQNSSQNPSQNSQQTADQSTTQPQQAQTIAEAAKQARDKRQNTPKPVKIVTEDDIDKRNVQPGEQGLTVDGPPKLETDPPSPGAVAAAEAADAAAGAPASPNAGEAGVLKAQLAEAQKELDILKRDLALQQDTFFSNADYAHDKAGKAKLDAMQEQVTEKQQQVDQLKAKLDALPASKLSGKPATPAPPPGPEAPAAPPQS
jgi:uncharacterized coiled-coil protein SlyX